MKRQRTAFILAVSVLLAAAVTLNGVVSAMRLHFQKTAVALRKPLDEIPPQLGPWIQVSKDEPLDPETEDVLGTKQYVFRDYVDSRKISSADVAALKKDQSSADFRRTLARVQSDTPDAVLTAAVTYYTGMVDTVAHIPDRCYVADGYEPTSYSTLDWKVGAKNPDDRTLQVRFINFEDATPNRASIPVNVAYFFQCNGSYESDPLNGVRLRLQDLSEKYGYYAKIELKTVIADKAESQQVMADFLRYALPPIEQCLPDWKAVEAQDPNARPTAQRSASDAT